MSSAVNFNVISWILIWPNDECTHHSAHHTPGHQIHLYLFIFFLHSLLIKKIWAFRTFNRVLHNVNWWTREKAVLLECATCVFKLSISSCSILKLEILFTVLLFFFLNFHVCVNAFGFFGIKIALNYSTPNCIMIGPNRNSESMQ